MDHMPSGNGFHLGQVYAYAKNVFFKKRGANFEKNQKKQLYLPFQTCDYSKWD